MSTYMRNDDMIRFFENHEVLNIRMVDEMEERNLFSFVSGLTEQKIILKIGYVYNRT